MRNAVLVAIVSSCFASMSIHSSELTAPNIVSENSTMTLSSSAPAITGMTPKKVRVIKILPDRSDASESLSGTITKQKAEVNSNSGEVPSVEARPPSIGIEIKNTPDLTRQHVIHHEAENNSQIKVEATPITSEQGKSLFGEKPTNESWMNSDEDQDTTLSDQEIIFLDFVNRRSQDVQISMIKTEAIRALGLLQMIDKYYPEVPAQCNRELDQAHYFEREITKSKGSLNDIRLRYRSVLQSCAQYVKSVCGSNMRFYNNINNYCILWYQKNSYFMSAIKEKPYW